MKYKNCEWWVEAKGFYIGIEAEVLIAKQDNEVVVIPERFQKRINEMMEEGISVAGLPDPEKGSYAQAYFILKNKFFDEMATEIDGEGEFPKYDFDPSVVY